MRHADLTHLYHTRLMVKGNALLLFYMGTPFCNFAPCRHGVAVRGQHFWTSEEAFMYLKALQFKDRASMDFIRQCGSPGAAKARGRIVRGYDEAEWEAVRVERMVEACMAKFRVNADHRRALLSTTGLTLVEASPTDTIWGIGMGVTDPRALNPALWKGRNLLGQALCRVRGQLIAE